jgi:hypothetical protein
MLVVMADNESQSDHEAGADELVESYRTILNELALLTTVSVLLFGFLLTSAGIAASDVEEWAYAVAIILVATATLIFVLPVAYHHLQYPYRDFEKFQQRTHTWMRAGLPLLGASFYLTLVLAISELMAEAAIVVAAVPLVVTLGVFFARKAA